jgi:hypothetical protein
LKSKKYLLLVLLKNLASIPIDNPLIIIDRCWNFLRIENYQEKCRDVAHKKAYTEFVHHLLSALFNILDEWHAESREDKTREHILQLLEPGF